MKTKGLMIIVATIALVGALVAGLSVLLGAEDCDTEAMTEEEAWQSLYAAAKAMEEEYKDVPEILYITWSPGNLRIVVVTADREDLIHVRDNVVPSRYRCWPVIVGFAHDKGSSLTSSGEDTLPWLPDPNPERNEAVRPVVGGLTISRYEPEPSGGGGGGGGEPPPVYVVSDSWEDEVGAGWHGGTLGVITYDNKVLTAAHVIAMDSDGNMLDIGEPVYQPYEEDTLIGELEAYIPIDLSANAENYADAAIATVNSGIGVSCGEIFSEEGNYWIDGWSTVSIGDIVRKSGTTTSITAAPVTDTSRIIVLGLPGTDVSIRFVDHIEVWLDGDLYAFSGDSGSAADKNGVFVGLVIGTRLIIDDDLNLIESYGIISKAEHIVSGLDIQLSPSGGGGGGGGGEPPPIYVTGKDSESA